MMNNVKNIIFDLGGVIFNVDYDLTLQAFRRLGAKQFDNVYTQLKQTSLFDDFETGRISTSAFRGKLKEELRVDIPDERIDHAWNAMLLDMPSERADLVKKLSGKYRVFLLSNTNAIHLPAVKEIIYRSLQIEDFNSFFEKTYYSHIIGKRKPDPDAFELVLKENQLKKEETIFVDDTPQHIEGAKKIGLKTIHITREKGLMEHFNHWA